MILFIQIKIFGLIWFILWNVLKISQKLLVLLLAKFLARTGFGKSFILFVQNFQLSHFRTFITFSKMIVGLTQIYMYIVGLAWLQIYRAEA